MYVRPLDIVLQLIGALFVFLVSLCFFLESFYCYVFRFINISSAVSDVLLILSSIVFISAFVFCISRSLI